MLQTEKGCGLNRPLQQLGEPLIRCASVERLAQAIVVPRGDGDGIKLDMENVLKGRLIRAMSQIPHECSLVGRPELRRTISNN
jgi:hypothetical protein